MNTNILLIGASGKSSIYLIEYLIECCEKNAWKITLCDLHTDSLTKNFASFSCVDIASLDIFNDEKRRSFIEKSTVVISMLPANLHLNVAKDCLFFKKHLFTASYVSNEMETMRKEIEEKGLFFMNEMGLDPGLDHMSAMKIIDEIKEQGGQVELFESYCGGLVAPESDNNPLNYKFSWNPRNVVLAGSAGAVKFLQDGRDKFIPYHKLFSRIDNFSIDGYGDFEAYANRDSLKYIDIYGLQGIKTMYRGTFRRPGYSKLWNVFVQLGMTDDTYQIHHVEKETYRSFLASFLPNTHASLEATLATYLNIPENDPVFSKLKWLGLFDDEKIPLQEASPAQILQFILEKKLVLEDGDKDMVVMLHKFQYVLNNTKHTLESSLVTIGRDHIHTAMAKTVGLPLAIFTKLFLENKIPGRGIFVPTIKSIYQPVLEELQNREIIFHEKSY